MKEQKLHDTIFFFFIKRQNHLNMTTLGMGLWRGGRW